ncbi:MAG: sulfite oxidase-like oxidoreductase [Thermoanaerobaculia bacterium]
MQVRRDVKIRPQDDQGGRVPPGQVVTRAWPVLHHGEIPDIDLSTWRLSVDGLVENPQSLSWDELSALPREERRNDVHCVTHWTKLDNVWEGVSVRALLALVRPLPEARYVLQKAVGGWTTNVTREDLERPGNILAFSHAGQPLTREHGWPCRLVIPHLYFWKGAKWISGLTFQSHEEAGFWEQNGYHRHGDPWKEERFREDW